TWPATTPASPPAASPASTPAQPPSTGRTASTASCKSGERDRGAGNAPAPRRERTTSSSGVASRTAQQSGCSARESSTSTSRDGSSLPRQKSCSSAVVGTLFGCAAMIRLAFPQEPSFSRKRLHQHDQTLQKNQAPDVFRFPPARPPLPASASAPANGRRTGR